MATESQSPTLNRGVQQAPGFMAIVNTVAPTSIMDGGAYVEHLQMTDGASTAAAGSTTTDAAVLPAGTAGWYKVTGSDGTKGVRIHASDDVAQNTLFIVNTTAAVLKIYPPTGGTINGGSVDAAFSTGSGRGAILHRTSSALTWLAL